MYPITEKAKDAGKNTIKNILHNEFDKNLINKPTSTKQKQNTHADLQHKEKQGGLSLHRVAKKLEKLRNFFRSCN